MEIRLVAEKGREQRVLPLPEGVTTVGRSRRCTIRIPVNTVSRKHCRLFAAPEGFLVVEDLTSANGTYLNGERITGIHVVRPGNRLKIGPITFVVEYELTPSALDALRLSAGEGQPGELHRVPFDGGVALASPHAEVESRTEIQS
jgi:pSer/pThr/pTyr-binding forkhead associated (FHA) protein